MSRLALSALVTILLLGAAGLVYFLSTSQSGFMQSVRNLYLIEHRRQQIIKAGRLMYALVWGVRLALGAIEIGQTGGLAVVAGPLLIVFYIAPMLLCLIPWEKKSESTQKIVFWLLIYFGLSAGLSLFTSYPM